MRLTGWILLLIGLLLCASIAWATLGFLLMGIGLISLQVAERGRQRAGLATAAPAGLLPPPVGAGLRPPTFEPVVLQPDAPPARQPRRVAWPSRSSDGPYDREAWRRLVESDPDLAQLAKVLADYGPQYVDELAASYLAAPDKSRLGSIVDGIIARARNGQPVAPAAPVQASRPPPLPRPEPQLVIAPEQRKPTAPPPAAPSPVSGQTPPAPPNPADMLEASLFAAAEEASAKAATGRGNPSRPSDIRPAPTTRREPEFRKGPSDANKDVKPAGPTPLPANESADLEASLFAAVSQAAAKRADPPKLPPPPERVPVVTRREPEKPEIRIDAKEPKPAPPPLPASKPTDDLDESLLAALAEISGDKLGIAKPEAAPKAPPASKAPPAPKAPPALEAPPAPETPPSVEAAPSPPVDDDLSEMIKKFAPDSSFLRKQ